ncbi:NAD(+) salvage pathway protein, variant 2 [Salvia divinorum]|uniref:Peroxidase n=1 Tax=Salvia divinorum TaxID=28513 RepID=A0ABD1HS32_SALDI
MAMKRCSIMIVMILLWQQIFISRAQLSSHNPYATSCPRALTTIKAAVYAVILKDRRIGASLLRLHFHDCFGCDASVLLDDTPSFTGEKTAGPNLNSLRGFEVIDSIKSQLEAICPQLVSCADILALAARDSVVALSGPSWDVQLGRRDSTTASYDAANSEIPSPSSDVADLISAFSNKGFSPKELVALSGAHTIGQARCTVFRSRIYTESNIYASFATSLKSNCPFNGSDDSLSPLDSSSPLSFDTAYFKNLQANRGLLHSDQELFNGSASTDAHVTAYTNNPPAFFADFAMAMIKMGGLSPLTGTDGQIRTNCRKTN